MRIQPITAEQASESSGAFEPWPAGEYDFIVNEAIDDISKAGNEQIKLTLHVFNRNGARRIVFDYLGSGQSSQWKVRHAAEAMGLLRQYDAGELNPHEMIGKPGKCLLRVKPAANGYDANNQVGDYVVPKAVAAGTQPAMRSASKAKVHTGGDLDDTIPF